MISLIKIRYLFVRPSWVSIVCISLFSFIFVTGCGDNNILQPEANNSKHVNPVKANQLKNSGSLNKFSGEELYRGIFLAHGQVAEQIPEIRDYLMITNHIKDKHQLSAIEALQERIIDAIKISEPDFFDSFERAMTSGDHLIIQEKLAKTSEITLTAISGMPEIKKLRQELKKNPDLVEQVMDDLKKYEDITQIDDAELQRALNISILQVLDSDEVEIQPNASIVVFIFAAAAVVAAVTIVAAQSYAVALNIAGAINVAAAVVAWVEVVAPEVESVNGKSLLGERIVHSIATIL